MKTSAWRRQRRPATTDVFYWLTSTTDLILLVDVDQTELFNWSTSTIPILTLLYGSTLTILCSTWYCFYITAKRLKYFFQKDSNIFSNIFETLFSKRIFFFKYSSQPHSSKFGVRVKIKWRIGKTTLIAIRYVRTNPEGLKNKKFIIRQSILNMLPHASSWYNLC